METLVPGEMKSSSNWSNKRTIFVEISQKYHLEMIYTMAKESGFEPVKNFFDQRNYFVNSLWLVDEH